MTPDLATWWVRVYAAEVVVVAQLPGSLLLLDLLFTSSDHHHPHMVLCCEDLDHFLEPSFTWCYKDPNNILEIILYCKHYALTSSGLIRITPRHLPPSYRPRHPSPQHRPFPPSPHQRWTKWWFCCSPDIWYIWCVVSTSNISSGFLALAPRLTWWIGIYIKALSIEYSVETVF